MRREKLQRLEDRWKVKEKWQKWNKEKRRIQIKHSMHWIYVLFFWMRLLCNFCCVVVFFLAWLFLEKRKKSCRLPPWDNDGFRNKEQMNEKYQQKSKIDWSQCILTRHWRIFFIYFFLFLLFLCRMSRAVKGCIRDSHVGCSIKKTLFNFWITFLTFQ